MLRVEFHGQPYDWFNLEDAADAVRSAEFPITLRENIAHYFNIPLEYQAVFDEDGLLSTVVDFVRALQAVKPSLQIFDIREMGSKALEAASAQLDKVAEEVKRAQQTFKNRVSSAAAPASSYSNGQSVAPTAPGAVSTMKGPNSPRPQPSSGLAGFGNLPYGTEAAAEAVREAALQAQSQGFRPSNGLPGFSSEPFELQLATRPAAGLQAAQMSGQPMLEPVAGVPGAPRGVISNSKPGGEFVSTAYSKPGRGLEIDYEQIAAERPKISDVPTTIGPGSCGSTFNNGSIPQMGNVPRVFEVVVTKKPTERYGFANVPTPDSRGLTISWIDANGLLAVWNARNPDKAVRHNDLILSVNGVADNIDAMRAQLQFETIRLRMQRT
jgi:hypothetical protein